MTTNTRPLGVTALGALLVIAPLVGVLGLFALMVPGTPLDVLWSINPTGRAAFQQHPALVGVALGAIPLTAMAGAGLLLMSRWGAGWRWETPIRGPSSLPAASKL